MPTSEQLKNLGTEIRRRRKDVGGGSLRKFAARIEISPQHLSQIERGYVHPMRGLLVPSDEVLTKLAAGLELPLSRLHALLGRMPDDPYPVFKNPLAVQLAERFDALPPHAQAVVFDLLAAVEAMVEREKSS